MSKRRPLVEGIPEKEESLSEAERDFVYGQGTEAVAKNTKEEKKVLPKMQGRVPITIRVRPEIGSAMKRASLQRQLDGTEPSSMQDIVDEALENWLKLN